MELKVRLGSPEIRRVVRACFPDYRGRKVSLCTSFPQELNSWWDGGSRNYYCFFDLATGKSLPVHSNHPFFEPSQPRKLNVDSMPPNVIVVEHSIFCGKDVGITIYVRPANLAKLLPEGGDLRA